MKCAYFSCLVIGQLIGHSLWCQFYFSSGNKTEPDLLWEAGVSTGALNCLTDIGGNKGTGKKFIKDINWNQTQWGGSLFISATWQYLFGLRLEASAGTISGTDKVLNNSTGVARARYLRNLQFKTPITEVVVTGELYPLMLLNKNKATSLLSPYCVAGIGGFYYNPQAWLNNAWVDLRPLHTEGEGFNEYPGWNTYQPVTWCIPAGAGIKYDAAGLVNLRIEMLYRFTGTDYLDDVSTGYIDPPLFSKYLSPVQSRQAVALADRSAEITGGVKNNPGAVRGNPKNKDAWFSVMFKAGIVLGRIQHK